MAQEPTDSKTTETTNTTSHESPNSQQPPIYTRSTSLLTWDEIPFANKNEKQGAIQLQQKLQKEYGIELLQNVACIVTCL